MPTVRKAGPTVAIQEEAVHPGAWGRLESGSGRNGVLPWNRQMNQPCKCLSSDDDVCPVRLILDFSPPEL